MIMTIRLELDIEFHIHTEGNKAGCKHRLYKRDPRGPHHTNTNTKPQTSMRNGHQFFYLYDKTASKSVS